MDYTGTEKWPSDAIYNALAKTLTRATKDATLRSAASEKSRKWILERADLESNTAAMLRELVRSTEPGFSFRNGSIRSHLQENLILKIDGLIILFIGKVVKLPRPA